MKYYELTKEEERLIEDYEEGELRSIPDQLQETTRYRSYAKSSLNRERNINIRLSERDLQKIKAKAAEKGLPYQTLVSSILHQYSLR